MAARRKYLHVRNTFESCLLGGYALITLTPLSECPVAVARFIDMLMQRIVL